MALSQKLNGLGRRNNMRVKVSPFPTASRTRQTRNDKATLAPNMLGAKASLAKACPIRSRTKRIQPHCTSSRLPLPLSGNRRCLKQMLALFTARLIHFAGPGRAPAANVLPALKDESQLPHRRAHAAGTLSLPKTPLEPERERAACIASEVAQPTEGQAAIRAVIGLRFARTRKVGPPIFRSEETPSAYGTTFELSGAILATSSSRDGGSNREVAR